MTFLRAPWPVSSHGIGGANEIPDQSRMPDIAGAVARRIQRDRRYLVPGWVKQKQADACCMPTEYGEIEPVAELLHTKSERIASFNCDQTWGAAGSLHSSCSLESVAGLATSPAVRLSRPRLHLKAGCAHAITFLVDGSRFVSASPSPLSEPDF
jgi:hypothetical protein